MHRDIMGKLSQWATRAHRMPLVLCGARQVGKTYVLDQLGETFEHYAYVNLMAEEARALFEPGYNAQRVLENISIYTGSPIEPGKTLVVIDEIQEEPKALTLMKAFCEEVPRLHVAAAGSYLGMTHHAGSSFPVGKVEMVDMYPMTLVEFIRASGEEQLADLLRSLDFDRLAIFKDRLERLLRRYYYVGGMPKAVYDFIQGGEDYDAARRVQRQLLANYDSDFSKHIPDDREVERVRLAFDSIPAHLGRENHKFVFGHIAKGARARDFETAIQWIVNSGLATRVHRVDKLALPLKFYRDLSAFKLYLLDVGLLGCAMETEPKDVILSNKALVEYKGALAEQYVCQQLVAGGVDPYYWTSTSGGAELDFVVRYEGEVAPLEVKAEENLRAKSLRMACDHYHLYGYRTSMSSYRRQDWMANIPLWAVGEYFRA